MVGKKKCFLVNNNKKKIKHVFIESTFINIVPRFRKNCFPKQKIHCLVREKESFLYGTGIAIINGKIKILTFIGKKNK